MDTSIKPINIRRFGPIIIFLLGISLLAPRIWSETSITGQDEYWLSLRTPMETMERGSWFTPWVNGEPRLKKPPLLYWAILLSYKLFGINLFAARIWGVLSGAGLAMCSCLLCRELFKRSGVLAGLITLATIAIAIEGRRAMLDLPVAFFTCMSVYFAIKWAKAGQWGWILLSSFSLGLSFLIKGPVGFLFFGVAGISALFLFGKWGFAFLHWSQIAWSFVLLLAICTPWPLAMACIWPNFLETMNGQIAARGFGNVHAVSPFSSIGKALGLVFPWSLILIAALIHSACHIRQTTGRKYLWLAVWFLTSTIPCFFMECFSRYMIPLVPAACVLCAGWLEQTGGNLKTGLLRISASLLALVSAIFCLFFMWFGYGLVTALICLFLTLVMLWVTFAMRDLRIVALAVAVLLAFIMGGLYPCLGINAMPQDLDRIVGRAPVAVYNSSQPSMLSIRLKRSVVRIRSYDKNDISLFKHFDGFIFMRETDAGDFEAFAGKLGIHFKKAGQFKTFWSRQVWIRFARKDAGLDDWKKAIKTRSLANLMPGICYYRVYAKNHADE